MSLYTTPPKMPPAASAPPAETPSDTLAETLAEGVEDLRAQVLEILRDADDAPDSLAHLDDLQLPEFHAADLANLLASLPEEPRLELATWLQPRLDDWADMLTYLDGHPRTQILNALPDSQLSDLLLEVDSDDALDLVEDIDPDRREKVFADLPLQARSYLAEGLTFEEDSAGRLMQRESVALPIFWTVGRTLDFLREQQDIPEDFFVVFVVDPANRPVGIVRAARLLVSRRSVKIADIIEQEPIRPIQANMDREDVAYLFRQYSLVSAPVVDEAGRLIGSITLDDVMEVIEEESDDDLMRMGGVFEAAGDDPLRVTIVRRLAWLGVNMFTAIAASIVIVVFETMIERLVALAVIMPILASMGGNAGTQALTVTTRDLTRKRLVGAAARRAIFSEIIIALINGMVFAVVVAAGIYFWYDRADLALIGATAMVLTMVCAGISGVLTPLILNWLDMDPAAASGVIVTTITDITAFAGILGLAFWLIS
ncbi:MAG: magnesium transporter [Pseudomonadota bacterium]